MNKNLLFPVRGREWKHKILSRIATSREFPTRLRIFDLLKNLFAIDLVLAKTTSGVQLLLNLSDYVQYQIYFNGNYEIESVKLFKKLAKDADTIFDIGSHIGQYALEAANTDTNQGKQIFAIDANPSSFSYLLNNILLNEFTQITPVLGAISDKHDLLNINIPSYGNLGNTQLSTLSIVDSYLISSYVFKELLIKYKIKNVDLIKIDIEGHEYQVFKNLFDDQIFPDKIIFEYIPELFPSILDCIELFKKNNYKIYTILLEPFNDNCTIIEQNLLASRMAQQVHQIS